MAGNYIISVDMGGTKILASVINSREGIIASLKRPTEVKKNKNTYIKSLAKIINDVVLEAKLKRSQVKAVCLGVPGSLNPVTGVIGLAPNLGLKNFAIKSKLQRLIPYPVLIENDVNLGALGIKYFGVGKKAKNMLVVFIGTGIGGAIVINGKLYRGSSYVAGEIGHIIAEEGGPKCGCGNNGCLEAIASRTAIVNKIIAEMKRTKSGILYSYIKSSEKIKSKAISNAIKSKDRIVIKHITEACNKIGIALASLTNFMNFDTIVLGGGLIEAAGDFMLERISSAMKSNVMNDAGKAVKIMNSKLGDDAAIYGGIALAEEFLGVRV
ncbi:MAG: ROK family protein [Ignavibacteriaceae bacterium]|nr:ROK family protein [Ignavibacteriaceae bacterium]